MWGWGYFSIWKNSTTFHRFWYSLNARRLKLLITIKTFVGLQSRSNLFSDLWIFWSWETLPLMYCRYLFMNGPWPKSILHQDKAIVVSLDLQNPHYRRQNKYTFIGRELYLLVHSRDLSRDHWIRPSLYYRIISE